MTDITERLRKWTISRAAVPCGDLMDEAADEIARLRSQLLAAYQLGIRHRDPPDLPSRTGTNSRQTCDEAIEFHSQCKKTPERESLSQWERAAITEASEFYAGTRTGVALRNMLERLYPAGSGYTSGISAGADAKTTLTDAQRSAIADAAEPAASCGGSVGEPVAWAVVLNAIEAISMNGGAVYRVTASKEEAERIAAHALAVVPLYEHPPQPTLTDAEREAVEWYAAYGAGDHAATLRALLERLGGGK